jgi:hypothetical protein
MASAASLLPYIDLDGNSSILFDSWSLSIKPTLMSILNEDVKGLIYIVEISQLQIK